MIKDFQIKKKRQCVEENFLEIMKKMSLLFELFVVEPPNVAKQVLLVEIMLYFILKIPTKMQQNCEIYRLRLHIHIGG